MGLNIKDILEPKPITYEELAGNIIAIDTFNMLYQFLTTIRARDGSLLTDSQGNVTSHIIGMFSRTTNFLQKGIKPIFVFDGEPPPLKQEELTRRKELKIEAAKEYKKAVKKEDVEAMKKFAARTTYLTDSMVEQAQQLASLLGCPVVQAPSEGEAQASYLVQEGTAWAVCSQDYDSLMYGAKKLIRNLSISGRKKKPGMHATVAINPELIELNNSLKKLGITQQQLIILAILIGTDYNRGGVKGIGPKKALALIKEHKTPEQIFSQVNWEHQTPWQEIYELITHMPVKPVKKLSWEKINADKLTKFLVDQHDFSAERVNKTIQELDAMTQHRSQTGLGSWLS